MLSEKSKMVSKNIPSFKIKTWREIRHKLRALE
jgi:hypothetical protein